MKIGLTSSICTGLATYHSMMFEDPDKKNRRRNLAALWAQRTTSDVVKIILIFVFLIASIFLYRYEPPTPRPIPLKESEKKTLTNSNETLADENPYGFHPFYQVHGRIEYKNPRINLCQGIDPERTILLTILSRASNVHIREAIRQTWGAIRIYNDIEVRLMFIVGVDDGMLKQIEIEQMIYHGQSKRFH